MGNITPPVKPRRRGPPPQTSSNDADDEFGSASKGGLPASFRANSSLGSSGVDFAPTGLAHLASIGRLEAQKRTQECGGKLTFTDPSTSRGFQLHGRVGSGIPSRRDGGSQSLSNASSLASSPRIDEEAGAGENNQQSTRDSNFGLITTSSNEGGPGVTMRFGHNENGTCHGRKGG
jgi:hypothetical protein